MKHKPVYGDIQDWWDAPFFNPDDKTEFITDDHPISKICYINKYQYFSETVNMYELDLLIRGARLPSPL